MLKLNEADAKTLKLRKDIEVIAEWQKSGKPFTKEQQIFAEQTVDKMLAMKMTNQAGIQIVSADNVAFLKKYEASNRVQDAMEQGKEMKEAPRVSEGLSDVANQIETAPKLPAQAPKEVDHGNAKNQDEGTVDSTDPKIGHQPGLPMPQKMAEELIQNAKWGIKIGAYRNEEDGINAQLTRKSYAEFVDTPDKYKAVKAYLKSISTGMKDTKKI